MNPFKSKKPEDVAKIVATFEVGLRAAELELERAQDVVNAACDRVVEGESTDAAIIDAQKVVADAEAKVKTERTKFDSAQRRYKAEIAALKEAAEAARWKKTAELGEEIIREGQRLEELQLIVAAKFKKIRDLSEQAVAECPLTDGSALTDGPMSPQSLEGTYRLLLYRCGLRFATKANWFDDPALIPTFEKQLRQGVNWMLKLRPKP